MERAANLLMGPLLAIAAILIMGPGGSSIMAQYAVRQVLGLVAPNNKRVLS
jgi:phosphoheptose isomerase